MRPKNNYHNFDIHNKCKKRAGLLGIVLGPQLEKLAGPTAKMRPQACGPALKLGLHVYI